jgi:hypothetical protein
MKLEALWILSNICFLEEEKINIDLSESMENTAFRENITENI